MYVAGNEGSDDSIIDVVVKVETRSYRARQRGDGADHTLMTNKQLRQSIERRPVLVLFPTTTIISCYIAGYNFSECH